MLSLPSKVVAKSSLLFFVLALLIQIGGKASHASEKDGLLVGPDEQFVILSPWIRATRPGQRATGAYFTIKNQGKEDDRLIDVSIEQVRRAEIHEMSVVDKVMKMRRLSEGLPLPAGATQVLEPGSFHLMFMGLEQPFEENQEYEVTLVFEKAGEVLVRLMALSSPK